MEQCTKNLEKARANEENEKNSVEIKKLDLSCDDKDITNIFHGKQLDLGQPLEVQGFRFIKKSIIYN